MEVLRQEKAGHLIPEVSTNLGYALPGQRKKKMWLPSREGLSGGATKSSP